MDTLIWFWAWTVEITVRKDSPDSLGEIWENLILIRATNADEAYAKAERIGRTVEGDSDGSLQLEGRPATKIFLGISDLGVIHERLEDGAEILFRSRRGFRRKAEDRLPSREEVTARLVEEVRLVQNYGEH